MESNRVDIIVDIETLGTDKDSTIIQIAAAAFNIENGETMGVFNECADISKGSISATGSTLKWWMKTNPELFNDILNRGYMSETELLKEFHQWLTEVGGELVPHYLWGNGILFDNAIIEAHFKKIGLNYPIFYRNDRDLRTLLALASMKSGIPEKEIRESCYNHDAPAHDAMNDVAAEIAWACKCWRIIMGTEQPNDTTKDNKEG